MAEDIIALIMIVIVLWLWLRSGKGEPAPRRNTVKDRWERKAERARRIKAIEAEADKMRKEGYSEELIAVILPTIDSGE